MKAYNLIHDPTSAADAELAGWSGGFPPDLGGAWPRCTATGHPMNHGFTLRLPQDFRRQGPELVAISFFQAGGGEAESEDERVPALFEGEELTAADLAEPFLASLLHYRDHKHPRQWDFKDILDVDHAVIWHTAAEFAGPPAEVPVDLRPAGQEDDADSPWDPASPVERERHELYLVERLDDPNTGKAPDDADWIDPFRPHPVHGDLLERLYGPDHLGGTLFPEQHMPKGLTPYVLEFEQLGPLNFGGGRAQLDLQSQVFDWACG